MEVTDLDNTHEALCGKNLVLPVTSRLWKVPVEISFQKACCSTGSPLAGCANLTAGRPVSRSYSITASGWKHVWKALQGPFDHKARGHGYWGEVLQLCV